MTTKSTIDQLVRQLAPQIGSGGVDDPDHPTARQLRAAITSSSGDAVFSASPPVPATVPPASQRRRRRTRRLVLLGAPVAAGVAVAVLAAVALSPSSPSGPRPAAAGALEITIEGDLVVARVADPAADPDRYAAEFAERGLDVRLRLVPSSPAAVGTVVYLDTDAEGTGTDERSVEVVEAVGECEAPGSGTCPVGIRIPADYGNTVEVVFGRAARPGEQYQSAGSATAPGEALAGLDLRGRRVSEVLDALQDRGQRATEFRSFSTTSSETQVLRPDEVPGDWYVHDVALWAPGEVLLFVGEAQQPVSPPLPPGATPPTSIP